MNAPGRSVEGDATLPLFDSSGITASGPPPLDLALEVIDRDLAIWEGLRRRAEFDPRLGRYRARVAELGRDLRSLRDCCLVSRHPRIRQALLQEAGAVSRRMKALGRRFQVSGLDVVPSRATG